MPTKESSDGSENDNWLKIWEFLGFNFAPSTDKVNYVTNCPWTGKPKLSVNKLTGMWQSFTGGKQGNAYTFIREYYDLCLGRTTVEDLSILATSREIPVNAFQTEVAYNGQRGNYLVPFKNIDGEVINLTIYTPGRKKPLRLPGMKIGLFGLEQLKNTDGKEIFICEGEWDMFALRWLCKSIGKDAVVVGVPGASSFKEAWVPYFRNRDVHACYDNDLAGDSGVEKCSLMLRPVVNQIDFLRWPELTPNGYDVRDLILTNGKKPYFPVSALKTSFKVLMSLMKLLTKGEEKKGEKRATPEEQKAEPATRMEVEAVFNKWLKMTNMDPLAVIMATCFANKIQGDPIWTMLVAPPGGSKTEMLMPLSKSVFIETVTTLTPAALVSGMKFKGGDPSLLLKLNNRLLVVKDLTTVLTGPTMQRDEIFGILRDAYDGKIDKHFASGRKSYTTKFGILAGVTPVVDTYSSVASTLGERFLKYRLDKKFLPMDEEERMMRAMLNVDQEERMRSDLQNICYRYLDKKVIPETLPDLKPDQLLMVIKMAKFVACMRASVIKDPYTGETTAVPFREVGTRLAKQLKKMMIGLCIHYDINTPNKDVIRITKEIALDTCPQLLMLLVKEIYLETKDDPESCVTTEWLVDRIGMSPSTVSRIVIDSLMLGLMDRVKGKASVASAYRLTKFLTGLIEHLNLFSEEVPADKSGKPGEHAGPRKRFKLGNPGRTTNPLKSA